MGDYHILFIKTFTFPGGYDKIILLRFFDCPRFFYFCYPMLRTASAKSDKRKIRRRAMNSDGGIFILNISYT